MRVTKNIKEYIERHVQEKVYAKYEAERLEAERQNKILDEFWEKMTETVERQAEAMVSDFLEKNSDIVERSSDRDIVSYCSYVLHLKDKCYINSVHKWRERANQEVRKIVDDIIVTLELGGTKADLDKMLSEI